MKAFRNFLDRQWRQWQINAVISLVFVLVLNLAFWRDILAIIQPKSFSDLVFLVSVGLLLVLTINLVLNLLTSRITFKYLYALLFLGSAISYYYMQQYHIVIDRDMVRNVMETSPVEAKDLLSWDVLWFLLLLFVVPTALIARIKVKPLSWWATCREKLVTTLVSLSLMVGLVYVNFPTFAFVAREHRHLSHLIVPTNFIFAAISYTQEQLASRSLSFDDISQSASLEEHEKKQVLVVVIGETARADRFSLNSYQRNTNPKLKQRSLVNFTDTSSCGTSTAKSLPCMLSYLERNHYNHKTGKNSSNLLDFFASVGFDVQWRDNNTGCKGLCDRVDFVNLTKETDPELCIDGECFDEILLKGLGQQISQNKNNQLILMHQKGSHGPAYYLRYPKAYEIFQPACHDVQLQKCSQQSLSNSYDNTILYTDYVVDSIIEMLESMSDEADVALVYVSDHGESLGENNLYLHGTPYFMAPKAQTRVPFFFWTAAKHHQNFGIDWTCLKQKQQQHWSHDNLFHSLMGLAHIHSPYYRQELDVFASCQLDGRKLLAHQDATS